MRVRKAIIPAAGLGTRFLPATKAQPKEMLTIVDKPTIQYIVEEAINSGIEDIIIVTGRNKRAIEDHFDKSIELETVLREKDNLKLLKVVDDISNLTDIHYIRQKEPRGLGHAIYCARKFIGNEPFAVLLGDDIIDAPIPCLKQMLDSYEKIQSNIIGVQPVKAEEINRYGIVKLKANQQGSLQEIEDLVEKPILKAAPSNIAVMGRYIIQPEIFEILEATKPGAGGEIQLTDALKKLCEIQKMYAYTFQGKRYDVGDKLGFLQATVEFALKRQELAGEFQNYLFELVSDFKNIEKKISNY